MILKIKELRFSMHLKVADGIANSVGPDQIAPTGAV